MLAKNIIKMAVAKNGVTGNSQNPPLFLPWGKSDLPGDLARFKADTYGYPIIMGRETAQVFSKPLPGRTNIYLSEKNEWKPPEGFIHFSSLAQAIQAYERGTDKIFIIGGSKLVAHALATKTADEMILTEAYDEYPGDVHFPEFDLDDWEIIKRESYPEFRYDIVHYKRRRP
jgi:dihydrofolate reductase